MAVEVVWSPAALARLREVRAYVARDRPAAAEHLALRITAIAQLLQEHPQLGRATGEADVRELIIGGTPFSLLYRLMGRRAVILTIRHGTRQPDATDP
ncbi:MAG TPA: type II toxin-antitoxin system RelE/ParE family toxin [Terriglobales bacterium]|nr:type II toxin-antitoxin system RelE/ParE family toxin [Terriglobales bacterium]